jgi:hypothetical protein
MRDNKAAQTIVGALVIYIAFRLWSAGYFSQADESEGFSNADVWLAIGSSVLSFVQLVGLIAISICLKLLPAFETMADYVFGQLRALIEKAKESISKEKKEEGAWDWRPLAMVVLSYLLWSGGQLSNLWDRITDSIPDAIENISDKPIGILFSVDKASSSEEQWLTANSVLTEQLLKSKGIERRLLSSVQDAGTSEPWVFEAVQQAPDSANSMVVYYDNGQTVVLDLPQTYDELQGIVNAW